MRLNAFFSKTTLNAQKRAKRLKRISSFNAMKGLGNVQKRWIMQK